MAEPETTEDVNPESTDAKNSASVDEEQPVLTDEEKSALLEGVASGAIEVQSADGPKYADVQPFEIAAHARIQTNSYPRLQVLNEQLASRIAEYCDTVLSCKVDVNAAAMEVRSFANHRSRFSDLTAVTVFGAPPLDRHGLIIIKSGAINHLVEAFFGGSGNDVVPNIGSTFTVGEMAVCRLFSNAVLSTMQDLWSPIIDIAMERRTTSIGADLVEDIGDSDIVLGCRFDMNFGESTGVFSILLPLDMIRPLVALFEGKKRNRDVAEDARWAKAIKAGLPEAVVRLDAMVGSAQMTLRRIASLAPGDIINIEDPQDAVVAVGDTPVLRGQFGVIAGRNAIETTEWIDNQSLTD